MAALLTLAMALTGAGCFEEETTPTATLPWLNKSVMPSLVGLDRRSLEAVKRDHADTLRWRFANGGYPPFACDSFSCAFGDELGRNEVVQIQYPRAGTPLENVSCITVSGRRPDPLVAQGWRMSGETQIQYPYCSVPVRVTHVVGTSSDKFVTADQLGPNWPQGWSKTANAYRATRYVLRLEVDEINGRGTSHYCVKWSFRYVEPAIGCTAKPLRNGQRMGTVYAMTYYNWTYNASQDSPTEEVERLVGQTVNMAFYAVPDIFVDYYLADR